MSVKLRGKKYHYRFSVNGKNHNGVCVNCSTEDQALAYEKQLQVEALKVRSQKTVVALIENYKFELTGGEPIPLIDGCRLSFLKPSRREPSAKAKNQKELYWKDFVSFLKAFFPDLINMDSVRKPHCESYVRQLSIPKIRHCWPLC